MGRPKLANCEADSVETYTDIMHLGEPLVSATLADKHGALHVCVYRADSIRRSRKTRSHTVHSDVDLNHVRSAHHTRFLWTLIF